MGFSEECHTFPDPVAVALKALLEDVERQADERFDEVLIRLLTHDLPSEPRVPDACCTKCGKLLREYIRSKLALHRYRYRKGLEWGKWSEKIEFRLRESVVAARVSFHEAECGCGLTLWKGAR